MGRVATALAAAVALLVTVTSCAAPGYTYASDSGDGAYFKVPASWPQVSAKSIAQVQAELSQSSAGAFTGTFTWSRGYSEKAGPPATEVIAGSDQPIVFATVQSMTPAVQLALSFDNMRDLLFPVTSQARSQAAKEHSTLTGFESIANSIITSSDGVRGINELYEYDINGQPDAFDQTVLTNTATNKLYLLLVQCYQSCFLAHAAQIKSVMDSFTVRGSS